jgi:hypothetical protein
MHHHRIALPCKTQQVFELGPFGIFAGGFVEKDFVEGDPFQLPI